MGNNGTKRLSNAVELQPNSLVENKEDLTLIWLDKNIDDSTKSILREIADHVLLYTEIKPCQDYILSIKKEKIFLIVSGAYAEQILEKIHPLEQVDLIFVFCLHQENYQHLIDKYRKIVHIFTDQEKLIQSIQTNIDMVLKQRETFNLFNEQKSIRDLTKESVSFLWFQLFKDVLLQMPDTEESKMEMIDKCRYYFRGNIEELNVIEEFRLTYNKEETIEWYTRQCFIYRLVNKALRTEDIELLYTFRFYIKDLCERLAREHEILRQIQRHEQVITLYRGLKLTRDELEKFQTNIGKLISTNGYLSTSRNRNMALQFASKISKRSNGIQPVLFEISADTRLNDCIFADVTAYSIFSEEEEVLFDLGSTFKILSVQYDNGTQIWNIKMALTNEAKHIVQKYIDINRREMEKGNVVLLFGMLFAEMGEYKKSQMYFENLLNANVVDDKASIYTNLGRAKYHQGQLDEALKDFKKAYNVLKQDSKPNQLDLARTMNNLGLIYQDKHQYDLALDYHFDVLKIYKQNSETNQLFIAHAYDCIGLIYVNKDCNYELALKYFLQASQLYKTCLPTTDHLNLATNFNNIGLCYFNMGHYDLAADYYMEGLRIREKLLPANHLDLASSLNNVGLIYHKKSQLEKSLSSFEKAQRIYEQKTNQQSNIAMCENNIGAVYNQQNKSEEALNHHLKALNILQSLSNQSADIAMTLSYIGNVYTSQSKYRRALHYYRRSLKIQEKVLPYQHIDIATTLNSIGIIYQKMDDLNLAFECHMDALKRSEKYAPEIKAQILSNIGIIYHKQGELGLALDIYKKVLLIRKKSTCENDNSETAWILNNIGAVYDDLGDFRHALRYHDRALKIRRKILPEDSPDIATSLNNIGIIYQKNGENKKALDCYKSALDIRTRTLAHDHLDIAI
ncbi:unnamed protein product, partial [Didymodactylos carnosus]